MNQAVIRRPVKEKAWFRPQAITCGVCDGQHYTGASFSPNAAILVLSYHQRSYNVMTTSLSDALKIDYEYSKGNAIFHWLIAKRSVSQTRFRGTLEFHRTSLGVLREIVEEIHNCFYIPRKRYRIPRNVARIFVGKLEILEYSPCSNKYFFIIPPLPPFHRQGFFLNIDSCFRLSFTERV
jgi:hypothetical protein